MEPEEVLSPWCPICGRPEVAPAGRTGFAGRKRLLRCGACGARFVSEGDERYRLSFCDPVAVARARGLAAPSACPQCIPCAVGRTMTRAEWARLGEAIHEPGAHEVALPPAPDGEVTLAVSEPVYQEVGEPSYRRRPGTLIVTTRRVVYSYNDSVWEADLRDIRQVEATPPGFRLEVRNLPQPVHFFPAPGDRIADVIRRVAGGR